MRIIIVFASLALVLYNDEPLPLPPLPDFAALEARIDPPDLDRFALVLDLPEVVVDDEPVGVALDEAAPVLPVLPRPRRDFHTRRL